MPYPIQKQMVRRTRELNNHSEHVAEAKHGFRGNVIDLNVNHNRDYLLDTLRLPLLSFKSKLQHLRKRTTMLNFRSRITHKNYVMRVVHHSGIPNAQRYQQIDHLQHLANAVRYDTQVCIFSRLDDNLLYLLTGRLYHSIGKSFSDRETYRLVMLRNALARMYAQHV